MTEKKPGAKPARFQRGHAGPQSTHLTNSQIRALRQEYADAYAKAVEQAKKDGRKVVVRGSGSQKELARKYGVTQSFVSRLVRGDNHREAGGPFTKNW